MKKRYVILAALLVTALAAAGCGKKKTEDTGKDGQVTVAPAENTDTASSDDSSLVDMQKSDDADIKNVIGDKTSTASRLILVNGTGAAVKGLYIRPTTDDDDDWGTELINGLFTLNDGDKALYYYEPDEKDADGNAVTSYDIRITYEDEDYTDCYFRKLPLKTISKITLHMDGTAEDGIPYATYLTGTSKTETSTLSEVMARLGLDDSEDSSEDDSQETDTAPTPTSAPQQSGPTAAPTSAPQPTSTPAAVIQHRMIPVQIRRNSISDSRFPVLLQHWERLTEVIMRTSRRPERQDIIIMTLSQFLPLLMTAEMRLLPEYGKIKE